MLAETFIYAAIVLIIVGVLLWIVNNVIPMDTKIKQLVNVLVIIGAAIFVVMKLLAVVGH